ncbi:MAG: hypothetical protein U1E28_17230 [Beijerinckiaceae bacterium]
MMISPDDPPAGESPTEPKGNPAVRMIVMHWILGNLLGIAFAGALILFDPIGLRDLLIRSDALVPGIFMLVVGFGTTFGGVVAATAVMLQKKDDDEDEGPPSGGRREPVRRMAPALAPARISRAAVRARF